MSDRHLRLLRAVARRRRAEADTHDATGSEAAASRGRALDKIAERTKARLSAAETRRRRDD
jgi:hypothetical protein